MTSLQVELLITQVIFYTLKNTFYCLVEKYHLSVECTSGVVEPVHIWFLKFIAKNRSCSKRHQVDVLIL